MATTAPLVGSDREQVYGHCGGHRGIPRSGADVADEREVRALTRCGPDATTDSVKDCAPPLPRSAANGNEFHAQLRHACASECGRASECLGDP